MFYKYNRIKKKSITHLNNENIVRKTVDDLESRLIKIKYYHMIQNIISLDVM